jgi:TniQ
LDSTSDRRKYLKFCPLCLAAEIEQYGEPYWYRLHQMPGLVICTQHRILLLDSSVMIDGHGVHYHAASHENCIIDMEQSELAPDSLKHLLEIATDLVWLLNTRINFRGMGWLRDRYIAELCKRGSVKKLLREELKVDERELFQSFSDFYGEECLNWIEPRFVDTEGKYLIHCLFAGDLDPKIDRVAHILISRYLFGSIASCLMSH